MRLAHEVGVKEVYLQRLVFCEETPFGIARPDQALFARLTQEEAQHLAMAEAEAAALAETGDGTVTETETGDEESLYEVEVTLDDGSQVDVQLDRNFDVVGSEADDEGEDESGDE